MVHNTLAPSPHPLERKILHDFLNMLKGHYQRLVGSRPVSPPVRRFDWTTSHLDLLRWPIEAADLDTSQGTRGDDQVADTDRTGSDRAEILAKDLLPRAKIYALANSLEGAFEPLNLGGQRTALFFGGSRVDRPACVLFSRAGQVNRDSYELLGYFHFSDRWRQRLQARASGVCSGNGCPNSPRNAPETGI